MANTLSNTREPGVNGQVGGGGPLAVEPCREAHATRAPTFAKAHVAELSMAEIHAMSAQELATVIRSADIPLLRESVLGHLGYYDRVTRERLAFLARHTVRNQGY